MKLGKAISIAAQAFEGEYDKSGRPYILHCLEVMNNVDKYEDDELRIIAVLHDLIEDTRWELDDVYVRCNATDRVITALELLTHIKDVPYEDYITCICTNQDAIKVKLADIEHNSSILRLKGVRDKDLQRIAKYHKAYLRLKEELR